MKKRNDRQKSDINTVQETTIAQFLIENAMRTRLGVRYLSSQIQQMLDEQMFEDYSKTEYELHV